MIKPLDIAFFGSSIVSAFWNGAATYYRGIVHALSKRGHRVTFYESDAFDRQKHRDIPDPSWARVVVYSWMDDTGVRKALKEARTADIVIKASCVGAYDEFLERAVIENRVPGQIVIFWDIDAPATLDRVQANSRDPFRPLIPEYDLILTCGGGPPVVAAYEALGARECVSIYSALDPATHYPVPPEDRFDADLAFLGNRLPDREARLEAFFLRAAEQLSGSRFLLGGMGWQDKPLPGNIRYVGHVYTTDHNAFNSTPLAVLNVSRESMARCGYSPATRVFEAAGAGACIITDVWKGIDEFLEPGAEILVARDGKEVAEHVLELSPERARSIGEAARRKVLAYHTYAQRAQEFEELLSVHAGGPQWAVPR